MANGALEGPYNINYLPGVFGMNHGQMPGMNGLPYGRLPYSSSRSFSPSDHDSDSVSASLKHKVNGE